MRASTKMSTRAAPVRAIARTAFFALLLVAADVRAEIYLDVEPDPMPLIEITVVVPAGFESAQARETGAAVLMGDILDAGTKTLARQAYLDRLASFGASHGISVSNLYSVWTLSFPLVDGKDYAALTSLIAENWRSPRLTDETFRIAARKLEASLRGSLDSDMGLGASTTRRWINRNEMGGHPITLDSLAKLERSTVATVWQRDFVNAKEIWAGVIAPDSSLPLVKSILSTVFASQGGIVEGAEPRPLAVREVSSAHLKPDRIFLILDKPGRTQTMTSIIAVSPHRYTVGEELAADFGRHVLVDSGLGSIFGEEIRTKRGLAYSVMGVHPQFLGYPSLGMAANPVRPKSDEALGVIADLVAAAYERGSLIDELPTEVWTRQWQSFIYGKLLERSSPDGRLGERMGVAVGALNPELYAKDLSDWHTDRPAVRTTLRDTWKQSVVVGAVVGDAKELEPLVTKHFPTYQVVVIPYSDSIRDHAYVRK
jgi:predicted Zn-dependent peptidase